MSGYITVIVISYSCYFIILTIQLYILPLCSICKQSSSFLLFSTELQMRMMKFVIISDHVQFI